MCRNAQLWKKEPPFRKYQHTQKDNVEVNHTEIIVSELYPVSGLENMVSHDQIFSGAELHHLAQELCSLGQVGSIVTSDSYNLYDQRQTMQCKNVLKLLAYTFIICLMDLETG